MKQAKFANSGHFLENARGGGGGGGGVGDGLNFGMLMYPDHLQNMLNFGHGLLIFLILASFWNRSNWRFLAIFFRMPGRNGLKFDMLMYPDYLSNCLHFGHGLRIFLIWAVLWLSETNQICSFPAFSWERIGGIGWINLVISEEMEKANFTIRKLSSHRLLCVQWTSVNLTSHFQNMLN